MSSKRLVRAREPACMTMIEGSNSGRVGEVSNNISAYTAGPIFLVSVRPAAVLWWCSVSFITELSAGRRRGVRSGDDCKLSETNNRKGLGCFTGVPVPKTQGKLKMSKCT